MATAVLQSRELPPEPPTLPLESGIVTKMETVYPGSVGNDMGISTEGFRAAKYNPSEWQESNYSKYYQSFVDRDNAERIRHESKRTANETEATTENTQNDVTKKLNERVHDIGFWKFELEREIRDIIAENNLLLAHKRRLEIGLRAAEVPALHIATDNLNCRQRRMGVDLVQDDVELSLLKEVEIINNAQDLLRKSIAQTNQQIRLNRDAKQELEMDWSDKQESHDIDSGNAALRNNCTNKQFYPGAAKFQEIQSTPESWAQFTHDNIVRAEHERMASIQLRAMLENILEDTSRDMREQCDTVDGNLESRVAEMEEAKAKLEENLGKVCDEITDQERNIAMLKKAIRDMEDPLKKAQTRLENRSYRPGVDMCRDAPHYGLVSEVNEIMQSIDALHAKLNDSENSLKDLQDNRMSLEKDVACKKNSLFIDRDKCMTVRERYPTALRLQGYQ